MNRKSLLIPLGVFVLLVAILGIGFRLEDPHLLPSEMVTQQFPAFELADLEDPGQTITEADIKGVVSLVNVWATWCANCVIEHPELLRISQEEGIPIFGVNYNDEVPKARKWIERYENPYRRIIVDNEGRLGIDLGVYGAPETFIVDANGVIQHRHVGIVTRGIYEEAFVPIIERLRKGETSDGNL